MSEEVDLFTDYIDYLSSKNVAFANRFIPYYLCSVGCHLLNIRQQKLVRQGKDGVYAELGQYPNIRLNTMMVAPPGFAKTFFMELMLDKDIGLIGGTSIPTKMVQNMTEAGFIGTDGGSDEDGEPDHSPGLAEKYSDGIVGAEEFDTLAQAMKTDHSSNLDNMMLTALDSGRVSKEMANVSISYDTNISMFAATQPMRMDLSSGFARRFLFIKWFPSPDEIQTLRMARRNGRGMSADFEKLQRYRKELDSLTKKVLKIDKVVNFDALDKIFDQQGIAHYEESIYERMAMGYSLLKYNSIVEASNSDELHLEIQPTRELKVLVRQAMGWRLDLMKDVEGDQIMSILNGAKDGEMKKDGLQEFLQQYSMNYGDSHAILNRLRSQGMIKFDKDTSTGEKIVKKAK